MGLLHPSSWKRLVQSFNALQIHQLGKPERQQPQLRHFLPQSKILVNKWPSQRGDRAKIYLVEHVQYIYIRLYIYLYIYNLYVCVCAHQQISQRPTKSGEEKKKQCLQGHTQAGHAFQVPEKKQSQGPGRAYTTKHRPKNIAIYS